MISLHDVSNTDLRIAEFYIIIIINILRFNKYLMKCKIKLL
jgi:hypothetical protein